MPQQTSAIKDRGRAPARRSPDTPKRQIVKTWAFDSVGPRKYALQIARAANGNPSLMLVEGRPQEDGAYRKSSVFIWSEDFAKLFATLDEAREFITANKISTPAGHKYDPKAKPKGPGAKRQPAATTAR